MTTKEEKYLAVAKKIKEADNKLTTEYYYKTKLERSTTEMLDLYNPIFFKYNQHLMEEGKPISLTLMTDEDRRFGGWDIGLVTININSCNPKMSVKICSMKCWQ